MPISCSLLCRVKAKEGPELRGVGWCGSTVGPKLANGIGLKGQVSSQAPLEVLVRAADILYTVWACKRAGKTVRGQVMFRPNTMYSKGAGDGFYRAGDAKIAGRTGS